MTHLRIAIALCMLAVAAVGCAPLMRTPERFLQLDPVRDVEYTYRATTADGVVVAVRVLGVDADRGTDLSFWIDATKLRLQAMGGYALLGEHDTKTDKGLAGRQLRFGHDEKAQPYQYWISLFTTSDRLVIVEAGGPEAKLKAHEAQIAGAIASLNP